MKLLHSFLSRYSHITPPEKTQKESIVVIIDKITGISLKPNQIVLQKQVLQLKTPSVVKSEIRLHQKEILEKIKQETNTSYKTIV